jgi:oligoribonuclease (3'-5' exoribonuclease)
MKIYRILNNLNNVRLCMTDIYKDIDEKATLKDSELNSYKFKLSVLKEIAGILRQNNDDELAILKEKFNFIMKESPEMLRMIEKYNIQDFKKLKVL